jgi:hypothetical protein
MAQGFSVNVYGTVNEQPVYSADATTGNLPCVQDWRTSERANFPTTSINIWGINPGAVIAGGVFCYGVIEVPSTGLTQLYSQKYLVRETPAQLATLRG